MDRHRTQLSVESLELRDVPAAAVSTVDLMDPGAAVGTPLIQQARPRYAVGTGEGRPAQVNVYDGPTNALLGVINPFRPDFTGGARVVTADLTGDGVPEVIVASGPGGQTVIEIYEGKTLRLAKSFLAYHEGFTGGVMIAAGDVNGDGRADIITGAGEGGGPHVQVFSGAMLFPGGDVTPAVEPYPIYSFYAYEHGFRGGISVAVGDVNGDGKADIITGSGVGGGPRVVVHSGATGQVLYSYFAYDPHFRGGVNVAAADLTGDGKAEVVTGAGDGGDYEVKAWSGIYRAALYMAWTDTTLAGVRVAAKDLTGDDRPEVIVATGAGRSPWVKVLNGQTWEAIRSNPAVPPIFDGGLYVG
jgi:hypothetical protein